MAVRKNDNTSVTKQSAASDSEKPLRTGSEKEIDEDEQKKPAPVLFIDRKYQDLEESMLDRNPHFIRNRDVDAAKHHLKKSE